MKTLIFTLTTLVCASSFAGECTISLSKGANYREINERFISFDDVKAEFERQAHAKGFTVVESGMASENVKISSTVHITNEYAELRQISVFTEDDNGQIELDAYSKGTLIDKSASTLVSGAFKKILKKIPKC